MWRRFQLRLELPMPTPIQMEEWFRRFEKRTGCELGVPLRNLVQSLKGVSFGEVEEFGMDVLRRVAMRAVDSDVRKIVKGCQVHWGKRFALKKSNSNSGE